MVEINNEKSLRVILKNTPKPFAKVLWEKLAANIYNYGTWALVPTVMLVLTVIKSNRNRLKREKLWIGWVRVLVCTLVFTPKPEWKWKEVSKR